MLKSLAGAGMLFFLLALFCAALIRIGVLEKQAVLSLLKTVCVCLGFALAYEGAARLAFALFYEHEGTPGLRDVICTGWLENCYEGLETGSGFWNLPGHYLGRLFLGEYVMGGVVFSLLLTGTGLHLIYLRLRAFGGEKNARLGQALVPAFPGVFFCFLPGWAAWAFLGGASVFFFAGKRLENDGKRFVLRDAVSEALFACFSVVNAVLLLLVVMRRIG